MVRAHRPTIMRLLTCIWTAIFIARAAVAQTLVGTAFTHQGRLTQAGALANGEFEFDFEFKLFDAPTEGNQQGAVVVLDDLTVSGGVFTVELDFSAEVFGGESRWLEVRVRPGAETGGFTLLQLLRRLTPTPYALHAASAETAVMATIASDADQLDGMDSANFALTAHDHDALYYTEAELNSSGGGGQVHYDNLVGAPPMVGDFHSLDASDGDPIDAVFVDAEGNTGIGTTAPTAGLHVSKRGPGIGDPELLAEIYDGDGTFSRLDGARTVFVSGTTAYVTSRDTDLLTIIDVSDPRNPALLAEIFDGDGTFSRLDGAFGVCVAGTTAYVASIEDDSLTIIDVSDPMNPTLLAEVYDGDGTFSRLDRTGSVYV